MKAQQCKSCGKLLDANTFIEDDKITPNPNDFSVCAYCGSLSRFDGELNLAPLTPEELWALNESDPGTFEQLMKVKGIIIKHRTA